MIVNTKRIKIQNVKRILTLIFGIIFAIWGILCILTITNDTILFSIAFFLIFGVGGILMILWAKKRKKLIKDLNEFITILSNDESGSLENIATVVNRPIEDIKREIKKLIDLGFLKGVFIDESCNCIVLGSGEVKLKPKAFAQPTIVNESHIEEENSVVETLDVNTDSTADKKEFAEEANQISLETNSQNYIEQQTSPVIVDDDYDTDNNNQHESTISKSKTSNFVSRLFCTIVSLLFMWLGKILIFNITGIISALVGITIFLVAAVAFIQNFLLLIGVSEDTVNTILGVLLRLLGDISNDIDKQSKEDQRIRRMNYEWNNAQKEYDIRYGKRK